jgi:5-methylcytosine-specific restriction enzyme subunit McrC
VEDNPDDLPDLIAEILTYAVEQRQRRQLSRGYLPREAVLNRVRGRIDVLKTERHRLLARGLVACRFEDLSIDTRRNRFVRAALESICRIVRDPDVARRCRILAAGMQAQGVFGSAPTRAEIGADRFGRHEADDRIMVAAARLAFDLALPIESVGANALFSPNREETWVRLLFERAVGGFYQVVLSPQEWHVRCGTVLEWKIEQRTAGIDQILPTMRTDIVLDHSASSRRIVIDTKFTSIVTTGWHREESLRSGYVYQIYATFGLKSGAVTRSPTRQADFCFIRRLVRRSIRSFVIQGHGMRFATVDLTASAASIRSRLLCLCDSAPFVTAGAP